MPRPSAPFAFALASAFSLAALATDVSGPIAVDTLWGPVGNPWTIKGDVTVNQNVKLTLADGAVVLFAAGDTTTSGADTARTELVVNGTLQATGSAGIGVTITATSGYGVRVTATGTATLDYTNLTGGQYGVVSAGTVNVTHGTFQNEAYGVMSTSGTVTISDTTFTGCTSYGLYLPGGTSTVSRTFVRTSGNSGNGTPAVFVGSGASFSHVTIAGGPYMGLQVGSFTGSVSIVDSIIASNGSYGLYFGSSSSGSPSRTVHHNDVWGHSTNYTNVSAGTGGLSANPLFVTGTQKLTENSPARKAATDGSDLGPVAWAGDPTSGLLGTIFTDRTLTGANTITGDLTVATGVTLTIAAGASLTYASGDVMGSGNDTTRSELIATGTLLVQGTSGSPVTFAATAGYGLRVPGNATLDWATITGGTYGLLNTGTTTATNVTIQNAGQGVRNDGGTLTFSNGTVATCTYGVYAAAGTTNLNSTIVRGSGTTNGEPGIYLGANAALSHVTVTGNPYMGVQVGSFTGSVSLIDSVVTSNGSYGVYFGSSSSSSPSRTVHHNDVWGQSTNYTNVSAGTGSLSANPLFVAGTQKLTENSPARKAASDASDLGALAWAGDPTSGLVGTLFTDRTLTGANTITGDLTVATGVTLTIAAGATLTYANGDVMASGNDVSRSELVVVGALAVQGASGNPAVFAATAGYGVRVLGNASLDWATISGGSYGLQNSGTTTATNVTIQNAGQGLRNDGGTLTFSNGTIATCTYGVYAAAGTTNLNSTIVRASGTTNGEPGIYLGANAALSHVTVTANPYMGIQVGSFTGSVSLIDSLVTSNGSYGVYFGSSSSTSPSRTVHHNDVWAQSTNYTNVSAGTGSISANPLFAGATQKLTENSPARKIASDGGDLGALAWAGDTTSGLVGTIYTNRTLTGANTITGDLSVAPGVTLTVDAGATLTFASGDVMASGNDVSRAELIVNGSLVVQGSSGSPVTFAATNGYGVRVLGSATLDWATMTGGSYGLQNTGTTTATNVTIQNAGQCLRNDGGTLTFSNGVIANCTYGVYAAAGTTNVTYTIVRNSGSTNGEPGIYLGANASLLHDTITANPYMGVQVGSFTGSVSLIDNVITSNGSYGVYFGSSSSSSPTRTVHHNDVWAQSTNYTNVSAGTGSISANPLFVAGTQKLTENSPARKIASDGTDLGALAWAGDATSGLVGTIYTNRTLTGANTITGDLSVAPGVTLTVAAGATLTWANGDVMASGNDVSRSELIVNGTLAVQGSSTSPVTLASTNGYGLRVLGGATLDWATITGGSYGLQNSGATTATNVTIQNAGQCLRNDGGTVNFSNGVLANCTYGVYAAAGTTNVSYTIVRASGSTNGEPAVYLGANASFLHDTITANPYMGVQVGSFTGSVSLIDSVITSNGSYGVYFGSSSSSSPTRTVHHNDVWSQSTNYTNVSAGSGSISANPLFVAGTQKLTENSPARKIASDGTDLGALAWAGDPTSGLVGTIYTNRTLTGANTITGDLSVAPGVTLTVAAGATLTFASGDVMASGNDVSRGELIVDGTLSVEGTSGSPVTVSAANGYGVRVPGSASLAWATITGGTYGLQNTGTTSATNVTVQNAGQCVRNDGGTLTFANGVIANCTYGVYAAAGTTNVTGTVIRNCGTTNGEPGVYLGANASLLHDTITANPYMGVQVASFTGSVNLIDNVISSNGSYGMYFGSSSSSSPTRTVHHNDVWAQSTNYTNVTAGTGSLSTNPLFVAGGQRLTENSPARLAASDGSDLGALPYVNDPTPGLTGKLFTNRTLTGANTITGDLTVATGVTLTVAAGATLTYAAGDVMGSGNDVSRVELIAEGTLSMQGTSGSGITVAGTNGYGLRVPGTAALDYVTITGGTYGVQTAGNATLSNVTIRNAGQGLRTDSGTSTLTYGNISNCTYGVYAAGGTTNVSWTLLSANGTTNGEPAVYLGANGSLVHDTIVGSRYMGVQVASFTGSVSLIDSIIATNTTYGVYFSSSSTSSPTRSVHHNDVFAQTTGYTNVTAGTGSITTDPLFVSAPTNYRLQALSPARGKASDGGDLGAFPYELPAVSSIVVTPSAPALAAGAAQQFTATAYDGSNNAIPAVTFTWAATPAAGTISASGRLVAGCTPGTYTDAVSASAGGKTGTTSVTVSLGTPATVTVSPSPATVATGASQVFSALVKDTCGNTISTPVSWSVVNGGGTIDAAGLFTAGNTVGSYTNTVRATVGSVVGAATVTVTYAPPASISIAPASTQLAINSATSFTATAKDAAGNVVPATVTWSVQAGGGSITSGGLFTAGATTGIYTDTVKATLGALSATASVTVVPGPLASLSIAPSTTSLAQGATQQFTAGGFDSAGNAVTASVTWSVVAGGGSITAGGLFTAGTVAGTFTNTVRATAGSLSASASVTVQVGPLAQLELSPAALTLAINASQAITATGRDANGNLVPATISWSMAGQGGSISSTGVFTAGTLAGSFPNAILATSGSVVARASVTVLPGTLAQLELSPTTATLSPGEKVTFTATGRDASGNTVSITPGWGVNTGGGSINSSGQFTAGNTAGTFTNTVVASVGGKSATATVIVKPGPLATLTLDPATSTIAIGGQQSFTATGKDAFGNVLPTSVAWSVVNGGGTIDANGTFSAGTTPGTYANTVKAAQGSISGTATVTIQAGGLATISITPGSATLKIRESVQFTAVGKDSAGNALPVSFTWTTTGGGTITPGGYFTAGTTPGNFDRVVKVTGGSLSAFASVTVNPGALDRLEITPAVVRLTPGARQQFTAIGRDSAGNEVVGAVEWLVTSGGGTIDAAGLFTAATAAGSYIRTVRATVGAATTAADVEIIPGPIDTVTVTPRTTTLVVRRTQQFRVTAADAYGNEIRSSPVWSVAIPNAGAVDSSGLFTASAIAGNYPGAVEATVDGLSAGADVVVQPGPLAQLSISPQEVTLGAGGTQQFDASGVDADGNAVAITPVWSVQGGSGRISQIGQFVATLTPGVYEAGVRASAGNATVAAKIVVTAGRPDRIAISPENPSVAVARSVQFTARALDEFGNEVLGLAAEWSVAGPGGTIDQTGLFLAGNESGTFGDLVHVKMGELEATTSVDVSEDFDHDGLADEWELAHELDPTDPTDAALDVDEDGLTNLQEMTAGADPHDADSDDDGAVDGAEKAPGEDTDGDTLPNVLDPDSDGDGLFDGTEIGVAEAPVGTDPEKGTFIADADPASVTDPLLPDTDGDHRPDGVEDANHDGKVGEGETDPNDPQTFCETDGDCGTNEACEELQCVSQHVSRDSGCGCGDPAAGALVLLGLGALARRRRR